MKTLLALLLVSVSMLSAHADTPLPADSLYQANIPLVTQNGDSTSLASLRGRVQLVSMIYTRCQMVCPMIVETMKMTALTLGEPASSKLGIVAVSFDPANDDVPTLRNYAARHRLNLTQWTLARADEKDVRTLAALLDIKYRQLPDGEFNHSTALVALDKEGRIVASTSVMGRVDPGFSAKLKALLDAN